MTLATHILLATDFSETSSAAIAKAGELARLLDAKLTILHVHGHPPAPPEAFVPPERLLWSEDLDAASRAGLDELKSTMLADVDWISRATLEEANAPHGICDYARTHNVDLIVLGSHGRTGMAHFFRGSVAEKVVSHAPCAVLVVPNAEVAAPC